MKEKNRFGTMLKRVRSETQSELVKQLTNTRLSTKRKKLEITKAMLSHFETGRYTPGFEYAEAFANVLGLPHEDILTAIVNDELNKKGRRSKFNVVVTEIDERLEQIALKRNPSLFIKFDYGFNGFDEKRKPILKHDPPVGEIVLQWLDVQRRKGDPLIDFWDERESYFVNKRQIKNLEPHIENGKNTKFQKKKGMKFKIVDGKARKKYDWIFYNEFGVRQYSDEEKKALDLAGKLIPDDADKSKDYSSYSNRIRAYAEKSYPDTSQEYKLMKIYDLIPEPDQSNPIKGHTLQFKHLFYHLLKIELSDPNSKARFLKEIALNQIVFPDLRKIVQRKLDQNTFRRLCYIDDKISFDTLKQLMRITCQYVDQIGDRFQLQETKVR